MTVRALLPDHSTLRCRGIAMALAACTWLAACSPAPAPPDAREQDRAPTATQRSVPPAAPVQDAQQAPDAAVVEQTIGGDGSQIQLDALTAQDVTDAKLSGELACSFVAPDATSLLHATGVVAMEAPAQGVVKVSGYVEPVRAPGGFNAIVGGATFTGQGKTIVVALTGPAIGGGESPPRPATLTYQRADGASRVFSGQWQCGP